MSDMIIRSSKLTPKGTRPRGLQPGQKPHQPQPGRNRPALHFDMATKTWHQPKRLDSRFHTVKVGQ